MGHYDDSYAHDAEEHAKKMDTDEKRWAKEALKERIAKMSTSQLKLLAKIAKDIDAYANFFWVIKNHSDGKR